MHAYANTLSLLQGWPAYNFSPILSSGWCWGPQGWREIKLLEGKQHVNTALMFSHMENVFFRWSCWTNHVRKGLLAYRLEASLLATRERRTLQNASLQSPPWANRPCPTSLSKQQSAGGQRSACYCTTLRSQTYNHCFNMKEISLHTFLMNLTVDSQKEKKKKKKVQELLSLWLPWLL